MHHLRRDAQPRARLRGRLHRGLVDAMHGNVETDTGHIAAPPVGDSITAVAEPADDRLQRRLAPPDRQRAHILAHPRVWPLFLDHLPPPSCCGSGLPDGWGPLPDLPAA